MSFDVLYSFKQRLAIGVVFPVLFVFVYVSFFIWAFCSSTVVSRPEFGQFVDNVFIRKLPRHYVRHLVKAPSFSARSEPDSDRM